MSHNTPLENLRFYRRPVFPMATTARLTMSNRPIGGLWSRESKHPDRESTVGENCWRSRNIVMVFAESCVIIHAGAASIWQLRPLALQIGIVRNWLRLWGAGRNWRNSSASNVAGFHTVAITFELCATVWQVGVPGRIFQTTESSGVNQVPFSGYLPEWWLTEADCIIVMLILE